MMENPSISSHPPFLTKYINVIVSLYEETVESVDSIIRNYEGRSIKTYGILSSISRNMRSILTELIELIDDLNSYKPDNGFDINIDHRGGWKVFFRLLRRIAFKLKFCIKNLPHIPDNEGFDEKLVRRHIQGFYYSYFLNLNTYFENILLIVINLRKISTKGHLMNEEEVLDIAKVSIKPIWLDLDSSLRQFRDLYNALKISMICSNCITHPVLKLFVRGWSALAGFCSNSLKDKTSSIEKQAFNIELMKKTWNLAEKGFPKLFVSLLNPYIKTKKEFVLPIDPTIEDKPFRTLNNINVTLLCNSNVPIHKNSSAKESNITIIDANINSEYTNDSTFCEVNDKSYQSIYEEIKDDFETINLDIFDESKINEELLHKKKHKNVYDHPLERDIIFHIHGGGFVSGSPSSHEMYLREWAKLNDVIIISVNYSKSPEEKYPVAINECFYVYKKLIEGKIYGIIPKKIIGSGDSAGGNLILGITMKAINNNIKKIDGLLLAYPVVNMTISSTPSRLIFAHDVLLPYYLLKKCLDAYLSDHKESSKDPYISPVFADDNVFKLFPDKIVILSAGFDPLLDDAIQLMNRLDSVNKKYSHYIFDLPHGFLNFGSLLPKGKKIAKLAGKLINEMLET